MKKYYVLLTLIIGFGTSAQVQVTIPTPNYVCQPGDCTALEAVYPNLRQTTTYSVASIPYAPSFPFTGGTVIPPSADDVWSVVMNLPFEFSFFGFLYNQILVGTNGVITFDTSFPSLVTGGCPWDFSESIPSANFPIKNAIFGVYQDTDIRNTITILDPTPDFEQVVNYYVLSTGINAAPNRVFVANFNELPQFNCNASAGLQTSQIVLHEGTNEIEIFIKKRTSCTSWNNGRGVVGIQNMNGTMGYAAPGRQTGAWSATNEAWRFSPSGPVVAATVSWELNDALVSNQNPYTACINEPSQYKAIVNYSWGANFLELTNTIDIAPVESLLGEPMDLILCTDDAPPYTLNLTSNEPLVLNGFSPLDYTIRYYDNLADAQDATPANILNPSAYNVLGNQTIYMSVEDLTTTGCVFVKSFNIEINPIPEAPTGNAMQTFTPGETLANLEVNGENIQWYDQATDGNLLPSSTPLINNTTYYASQTLNGCSGRMSPGRLAVTATSVLGLQQFAASEIRLYPNPASNMLTVSYPQNISKIAIYNILGQLVFAKNDDQKEIKLDISALTSGTYFIKINSENADRIAKFVKK